MLIALILLGLIFGSFANALIWRTHQRTRSIFSGRSICPHCKHQLAARDLVPLLSWLSLGGRCRYCHKPISRQYPIVELLAGSVFGLSYIFWPESLDSGQWVLLITWLASSVGLLALAVYDLKWMLLPNQLIYPTLLIASLGRAAYITGFSQNKLADLTAWLAAVAVASGIFWLIFYGSRGKWIGYGDVRLGLITGTLLATPAKSLLMIFTASVLGTLFVLPAVIARQKSLSYKLPYGPFLILAAGLVILFGAPVIDWYSHLLSA